jgi:hypothetical protein
MKAIVYCDYGTADVLRLEDVEKPSPDDDRAGECSRGVHQPAGLAFHEGHAVRHAHSGRIVQAQGHTVGRRFR